MGLTFYFNSNLQEKDSVQGTTAAESKPKKNFFGKSKDKAEKVVEQPTQSTASSRGDDIENIPIMSFSEDLPRLQIK
jgi:hypothetical protein